MKYLRKKELNLITQVQIEILKVNLSHIISAKSENAFIF